MRLGCIGDAVLDLFSLEDWKAFQSCFTCLKDTTLKDFCVAWVLKMVLITDMHKLRSILPFLTF